VVPNTVAATSAPLRPATYREQVVLNLGHAVADPAAGALGADVLFAGGLDASKTSTARIGSINGRAVRTLPSLPSAFHDAAGTALTANVTINAAGADTIEAGAGTSTNAEPVG